MTAKYSPRGGIHVQPEAKDRGKQCARERCSDDSPSACPTAHAVTPSLRLGGYETTKYARKGVLHDFARRDDDFCRS